MSENILNFISLIVTILNDVQITSVNNYEVHII
jgi:hypothetical protein